MTVLVKKNSRPTPASVRAWGRENDFDGKTEAMVAEGTRGRLNPALINAFNAVHKGARSYSTEHKAATGRTLTVKPVKGRSKTVTYDAKALRKALAESGQTVKSKGRLPESVVREFLLSAK